LLEVRQGEYFQLRELDKVLNADVVKKARARGSSPPWLKAFAGQLEDPEYVSLTLAERGFLHDLRLLALRRGNKLLNAEHYLRVQLRLTPRTLTGPKVDRLCALGFLEPYNRATNVAANQLVLSLPGLEPSEIHSAAEVEVEVELPPSPPHRGEHEPTARRARTRAGSNGADHSVKCPQCGLEIKGALTLAEHLYNSHDGPVPAHYAAIEARAVEPDLDFDDEPDVGGSVST